MLKQLCRHSTISQIGYVAGTNICLNKRTIAKGHLEPGRVRQILKF